MKLKRFNKSTATTPQSGKPFIYVHHSGTISISPAASLRLELKEGSGIEILQDEEKPKNWYITKSNNEDSIRLRADKQKGKFNFNSGATAQAILKCLANDIPPLPRTASLLIGKDLLIDDEILWPIITASFIKKK